MFRSLPVVLFFAFTGTAFCQDDQSFDRIERGRYLAVLSDCSACHTVPGESAVRGWFGAANTFWPTCSAQYHSRS